MAILQPSINKKTKVKLIIDETLLSQIKQYCKWANLEEEDFFTQAANYIFKKDKEWNNHIKQYKKQV